jgi:cell wall-associated NlpC family hydrolase
MLVRHSHQSDDLEMKVDVGLPPSQQPLPAMRPTSKVPNQQYTMQPATKSNLVRGRLARVNRPTPVRISHVPNAPILHTVFEGQAVVVLQESTTHYAVLMQDKLMGYIPKVFVELIQEDVYVPRPGSPLGAMANHAEHIIHEAFTYLGVPYVWAGNTRRGLDCSAFVKNVFRKVGINLPRHSGDQARIGQPVQDLLRTGDRLYFAMKGGRTVTHCGIYIGDNKFIHASTNNRSVAVDTIAKGSHYGKRLVTARR